MRKIDEIWKTIYDEMLQWALDNKFQGVVFGSSGGIDSAVVASIARCVFGTASVHAIRMPSRFSGESTQLALELHQNLECQDYLVPIEDFVNDLREHINLRIGGSTGRPNGIYNDVADENLQARIRANILMHFSNAYSVPVLNTGNLVEEILGYFTLYGDSIGALAPLAECYKEEVYELGRYGNDIIWKKEVIPQGIFDAAPSAQLSEGQTDESSLLPYNVLDQIVKAYVDSKANTYEGFQMWLKLYNNPASVSEEDYARMIRRIKNNAFKLRYNPPAIKAKRSWY